MSNPHQVTKDFEKALCKYTGAPFAVAVNSCTSALLLAVAWHVAMRDSTHRNQRIAREREADFRPTTPPGRMEIEIPRHTYISVPMSIIHAGGRPVFRDEEWVGKYQLVPLPVWDSARWFTSGMYKGIIPFDPLRTIHDSAGQMLCVSFHASKTLGIEQGGAILHDNPEADAWLRRARFDGREEGVSPSSQKRWDVLGFHCYLNPSTAAQGILRLHSLPKHNAPLENDRYPDLSKIGLFK